MKKIIVVLLSLAMLCNQYGFNAVAEEPSGEDNTETTETVDTYEESEDINKKSNNITGQEGEEKTTGSNTDNSQGSEAEETDKTIIESSNNNELDSNDSIHEEESIDEAFLGNEIIDIPVVYSTNGYTQEQAVAYACGLVGTPWDVDNGSYDCVDIIKKYFYDVGGFEYKPQGDAGVYATTAEIPDGWTRMYMSNGYTPQPGDVACWDFGAYMWNVSLEYGHVGVVTSVNGNTITIVDQDSTQQRAAAYNDYRATDVTCYIHPDYGSPTPTPDPVVPDYGYEENEDGTITITVCNLKNSSEIIIPDSIDGKTVSKLGWNSFYKCTDLTHVKIPDSVIEIGERTNATYGEGFGGAFNNLEKLEIVEMSHNVTFIAQNSFYGCAKLRSINIPRSLQEIEERAFKGCISLKKAGSIGSGSNIEIDFTDTLPSWGNRISYLYSHCLFENLEFITLPTGLKTIDKQAFIAAEKLREIRIPDGVTSIGEEAFLYCKNLNKVVIPASVTNIGENAFLLAVDGSLPKLLSVGAIGSGASIEIGFNETISDIYSRSMLFRDVTQFEIPYTVKKLGDESFRYCSSLTEIEIPDNVTSIGNRAFQYTNLTSITIPGSVKTIGEEAFQFCDKLKTVSISNGVKKIGKDAFSSSGVINITISNTLEEIGDSAFAGSHIKSIVLPDSVVTIGSNVFSSCTELENVTLSKNINKIEDGLFSGCTQLKIITIPNGVTEFGYLNFQGCTSLTSVIFPDSLTDLGKYTFNNCTSLKEIRLPSNISKIDAAVFWGCTSLKDIYFTNSVKEVGWYSFGDVPQGLRVHFTGTINDWNSIIIQNDDNKNDPLINATVIYTEPVVPVTGLKIVVNIMGNDVEMRAINTNRIGSVIPLRSKIEPENATNKNIIWSSSNTNVASVDQLGNVTSVSYGSTVITARTEDSSKSATCTIRVLMPDTPSSVMLDKYNLEMRSGESATLTATVYPEEATNKNVTWESSNSDVATVDRNGNVTAIKPGNAIITVTTEVNHFSNSCNVNVTGNSFKVNVNDENGNELDGTGNYEAGSEVTITVSETKDGKEFIKWTVTKELEYTNNTKRTDSTVSFIMPEEEVTFTAVYGEKDSVSNVTANVTSLGTNPSTVAVYSDTVSDEVIKNDVKQGAGMSVDTGDNTSSSGNEKEYEVPALPEGTYKIAVYKPGYLAKVQEITVTADSDLDIGDIELHALGDVDGKKGITVSDIIVIRDIILEVPNTIQNLSDENREAANVNASDGINVSDIILVRDRILEVVGEDYRSK